MTLNEKHVKQPPSLIEFDFFKEIQKNIDSNIYSRTNLISLFCCLIILMALLDDSFLLLHYGDVIFDDIVELLGNINFNVLIIEHDFVCNCFFQLAYCSVIRDDVESCWAKRARWFFFEWTINTRSWIFIFNLSQWKSSRAIDFSSKLYHIVRAIECGGNGKRRRAKQNWIIIERYLS